MSLRHHCRSAEESYFEDGFRCLRKSFPGSTTGMLLQWYSRHEVRALEPLQLTPACIPLICFDWQPKFPVCVVFGHEVGALRPELLEIADTHVRIPMLGKQTSLNVGTAAGIVLYELLRKYCSLSKKTT